MPGKGRPFKKGESKGRPKGTVNKMPVALKDMILKALGLAGGETYLLEQSVKNPTAFLTLVGRVLPFQVKQDGTDPTVPTVVNHHYDAK